MSLDVDTLKAEFLKLIDPDIPGFVTHPTTIAQAAANFATAYDNYAKFAQDVSGDTLVAGNTAAFSATLVANLPDGESGTIALGAAAFAKAFSAYSGLFSVEVSSIVTAVDSTILENLLLVEFASLISDMDAKADSMANAFHTATTTAVTVLIAGSDTTPTPAGPYPITNTNFVY